MKKKRLRLKKNFRYLFLTITGIMIGLCTIFALISSLIQNLNAQILWMQFCAGLELYVAIFLVTYIITDSVKEDKKKKRLMNH